MTERQDTGTRFRARVAAALAELEKVARELLTAEQHVAPEAKVEAVELPIVLSFHGAQSRVASEFRLAEAEKLVELLRGRVRDALLNAVAFERGHVYCLRCESSRCNHSSPPAARAVFAGYEPTGRPEWLELDQLLHRRADPRLERIYSPDGDPRRRRELVAVVLHRDEIYGRLLPGFDEPRWRCYVLGQLCFGYFVPDGPGGPGEHGERGERGESGERRGSGRPGESREPAALPMALTVQVVRVEQATGGPLLGLNVIGRGSSAPGSVNGRSVEAIDENVYRGLPDALRRLRRELSVFSGRGGARVPGIGIALERLTNRCDALLRDASRELEHQRRVDGRRTGHARDRARQGDRPTHKAFEDARAAADDHLFFDVQESTVCVVGPGNRVHFFTATGKQVTSVVFPSHVVQQRVGSKRWAPLEPEKRATFRRAIETNVPGSVVR